MRTLTIVYFNRLKESYKNGVDKATNKSDRLKEVARQVKEKAKTMKESAIKEAIEVLEPYKQQLGKDPHTSLWIITNSYSFHY